MAAWNIWKASFLQGSPVPLEPSTPQRKASSIYWLFQGPSLLKLTCSTKHFDSLYVYFRHQSMVNTIKRFCALCLDTYMKLALNKYAIIIIIIIILKISWVTWDRFTIWPNDIRGHRVIYDQPTKCCDQMGIQLRGGSLTIEID